ncbi:hypothetical protein [Mycobacterium leprae]|uniref:hypothetical protein n=1 Tax=Mycobacterium leprae TaxID=1769 RepID=UPI001E5E0AEE|nr:hypothetical protein [Mycobacterium leprae]
MSTTRATLRSRRCTTAKRSWLAGARAIVDVITELVTAAVLVLFALIFFLNGVPYLAARCQDFPGYYLRQDAGGKS